MGEIAEDMLDGTCCFICGQYFEDPEIIDQLYTHGYPVACNDCFDQCLATDNIQKAEVDTL